MANADEPINDNVFCVEKNARGLIKISHNGHIRIADLKTKIQHNISTIWSDIDRIDSRYELKISGYLSVQTPDFPTPVEFHTSELMHVTNCESSQILQSGGFKANGQSNETFSWWSLKIDEEHIKAAEERFLEERFPNRTQEQKENQEAFLSKFTTSPAFSSFLGKSRYGTVQFTFPLNELMEEFKSQMCGGKDPVLREYKTTFYKQEIMYVVLVHSPEDNEKFRDFQEIKSSSVVDYQDGKIIWKAQAICKDFKFKLSIDENENTAKAEELSRCCYYVWDHVAIAFHFRGILQFSNEKLRSSRRSCQIDEIDLSGKKNFFPYRS